MTETAKKKKQLRLELPKDASAIYANTVMITHTANEVIFDFIQVLPNDGRARVQKRIVMTPTHAKLLLQALQENLQKYETKHGEIVAPQRQSLADQLFGAVKPEQEDDEDE
ncbi:MAG: DUF3467 domain-containing protein [Chloroflexi bacterium]|nr:DUF3467 domain-containing protein [Chloroflexota bacterium]